MLWNLYTKVVLNGLPTAALAAFALTRYPWLGYALCLLTLAQGWHVFGINGLGQQRMARALVVTSVLVEVARPGELFEVGAGNHYEGLGLPLAITGVLLVGQIAFENELSRALMTGKLRTANLAVRRSLSDRLSDPRWAYLATTSLLVLYLLCAAFMWMVWALAVLASLLTLVFFVAVLAAWRERRSAAHHLDLDVHEAIAATNPKFMVHFASPPSSEYQVLMWLPFLDRIGEPYYIVVRERYAMEAIARATDKPVVVAPSIANLEHTLVEGLQTVFYVNNGMKNTHCVRFGHLTHVQLLHGDSDKAASYNPITTMFDRVYVAGQAGVDRYHKHGVMIPSSRFRIVGRPQVADVEVSTTPVAEVNNPTVLYAPTWTGNSADVNYSSLTIGATIVRALLSRGATVILRPHPYTRKNPASAALLAGLERILNNDASRTGRKHRWGSAAESQMALLDCINAADVMISDVSAVAADWLYSEKPFATTDMQAEGELFAETFPLSRAAYVIDFQATNLDEMLDSLLGADPLAETRRGMKNYYLGDFPADRYVDAFVDEARRCVRGEDPDDETATDAGSVAPQATMQAVPGAPGTGKSAVASAATEDAADADEEGTVDADTEEDAEQATTPVV